MAKIETIETCGELGALLTEARLVKESKPVHNRALQGASMLTIARRKLNEDGQYVCILEDLVEIDQDIACDILGVFRSKGSARRFLTEIMQNFYLCPKLLGLEKSKSGCFRTQLSKCWGVCKGDEPATTYNLRFEQAFAATSIDEWPFDGPVTITETLADGSRDDMVIFRWCLIERTIRRPEEIENVPVSGKFDLDTYRIIRSHIRQGKAELMLAK